MNSLHVFLILSLLIPVPAYTQVAESESFGDVAKRLKAAINDVVVLKIDKSMIAISPSYQGRIFTSTTNGNKGKSRGWINWELIDSGKHKDSFAYLGGESRFWLAPEFGSFSIFFDPGKEMTVENMRAPRDLDSKKFLRTSQSDCEVSSKGTLKIINASGFSFDCGVERKVILHSKKEIESDLKISLPVSINYVAFSAETILKNIGLKAWEKDTGLLSIWELGCMLTSPRNRVIIPVENEIHPVKSYFSKAFNKEELVVKDNIVYFKADGSDLGKLGISPKHTKNVMGSYSPELNLLNIVKFSFNNDDLYVNSFPGNMSPYSGDVINIFNGEVNKEKNYNWPFYEFESSSSTKELQVDEEIYHKQTLYHFEGTKEELAKISKVILGADIIRF
ncbi:DUF6786 family protein [Aquimarina agarilytica]|uniref:DUF6786 family protein n=1 Tax=Aquimarina agarilytica TaxID=1087449 RepID=UPI0012FBCAB6|nr:DUF6786 family protein [Aquimarina agarilytica]